jgi:hypothetical protein
VNFDDVQVGMIVEHPLWGSGKVQAVRAPYVWIYFPQHRRGLDDGNKAAARNWDEPAC